VVEAGVRKDGARVVLLKAPGAGKGGEVASTGELATEAMMAHGGGDGMAQAGGVKGQLGHSARWCKAPNRVGERVNGEAMEHAAAGGDRVDSLVTSVRRGLTSRALFLERERFRGSEGERG
jgi:hypothetical protein